MSASPPRNAHTTRAYMQPETWQKLESIFFAALELAPEERGRYLDNACAGDAAFRAEIDAVLMAHEAEEERSGIGGLEPGSTIAGRGSLVGTQIGAYLLDALVERGGMGIVYRGHDTRDGRPVAVKVLGASRYSETFRRRFRREQRILAALDHPHVARLLDAGITDDGIPYLIMEYVEGLPIDAHCAERGLALETRLRLFCDTARAVHYAHESNVVHRDLKPSNILVTSNDTVKLLDFGIAKIITDAGEESGGSLTESGMLLMTPSYAAPEQVAGAEITPATDIYALGVVLYGLLTGRLPLDLRGRPPGEIVGAILEEQPPAPSEVDYPEEWPPPMPARPAAGAGQSVERYRRYLKERLDAVALTALAKAPERRHRAVWHMVQEIEATL